MLNCKSHNVRVWFKYYGKSTGNFNQNMIVNDRLQSSVFHDKFYTIFVIWDSHYCLPINQLNVLRFGVIDSPPIIQGLHLDPKKNTKHASVPLHNLQILNATIYNHYWTRPVARVHSGSITFENIGRGCTHENSACSLFVVTSRSEHTMTSIVLMWRHIIGKEGKQDQPHNRTVMAT